MLTIGISSHVIRFLSLCFTISKVKHVILIRDNSILSVHMSCEQVGPMECSFAVKICTWICWVSVAQLMPSEMFCSGKSLLRSAIFYDASDICSLSQAGRWYLSDISIDLRRDHREIDLGTITPARYLHVCTGTPFFALLIRPVTGVYLTGTSPADSEFLDGVRRELATELVWFDPPAG